MIRRNAMLTTIEFVCGLGLLLWGIGVLFMPLETKLFLNYGFPLTRGYLHMTVWLLCTAVILFAASRSRLFLSFEDAELEKALNWVSAYIALIALITFFFIKVMPRFAAVSYEEVFKAARVLQIAYIPVNGFLIPTYFLFGNDIWSAPLLYFVPSIFTPRIFLYMLRKRRNAS